MNKRKQNRTIEFCSTFNTDFSETIAYNNPLFPAYIRYGILSAYPDYSAVSHWHNDLEFILIKSGEMTYNVNGEMIILSENNGIMVNSRQLHYGFSPQRHECEFICVVLSPELLRSNEWFFHNYIKCITENPACPYLFLEREGWQGAILAQIEKLYQIFVTCTDKEAAPYFEVITAFASIMKQLYENLPVRNQIADHFRRHRICRSMLQKQMFPAFQKIPAGYAHDIHHETAPAKKPRFPPVIRRAHYRYRFGTRILRGKLLL